MKNICVIINKKIRWLETFLTKNNPGTQIVHSSIVYDRDCQSLRIREHDDGELYMFGNRLRNGTFDYIDCHELFEKIPAGRYIYMDKRVSDTIPANTAVIAMPDAYDFESYLAIASFLEKQGYGVQNSVYCLEIPPSNIEKAAMQLSFETGQIDLSGFKDKFANLLEDRKRENFISHFPISRDIGYLQIEAGMNNLQFAKYFNTSVRNVENWRKNPSSLKDYIYDLFEYKLLKEGII